MKTFKIILFTTVMLLVIVAFATNGFSSEKNSSYSSKTTIFPDSVKTILENSCFACHSNIASNGFAKSALNFDKWDTYKEKDQEKYKTKICNKITADKMPPSGYINKNPQAKLSEVQKTTICDWTKPIQK